MSAHRPECIVYDLPYLDSMDYMCARLAKAKQRGYEKGVADEREKAAQRVEALRHPTMAYMLDGTPFPQMVAVDLAVAAARGEDTK